MVDPSDIKTYARPRAEAAGLHWLTYEKLVSGDVSPRFSIDDGPNGRPGHPVLSRQSRHSNHVGSVPSANLPDLLFGQASHAVTFAAPYALRVGVRPVPRATRHALRVVMRPVVIAAQRANLRTSLLVHVSDVAGVHSQPQMADTGVLDTVSDVDPRFVVPRAGAVVAGMEYFQAGWNRSATGQLPGETVRQLGPEATASIDRPIPGLEGRSGPLPATLGAMAHGDLSYETVGKWRGYGRHKPARRGVTIRLHCDLPLARNRGAGPGLLAQSRGISLRESYHV